MLKSKSVIFFCLFFVFIFAGCDSVLKDSYSISNNSSNTVTFTIKEKDSNIYTLVSGASESYTLYDYPKITITSKAHQTYYYDDGDIDICDMEKHVLNVENQTAKEITLTEDDDLLENYGASVEVDAKNSKTSSAYGSNFSAVDSDGNKREVVFSEKDSVYYVIVR